MRRLRERQLDRVHARAGRDVLEPALGRHGVRLWLLGSRLVAQDGLPRHDAGRGQVPRLESMCVVIVVVVVDV